ncbi:MAG TPA: VCBS repeat-containing protein [Verrucomicrobiota bacterium]|nr:VCBS repeat-containing protein [Verrucomicrobiota bacterium]
MNYRTLSCVAAATLLAVAPSVGQVTFTLITTGPIPEEGGYSNRGCWVDYDNDGDLDLFVSSSGGQEDSSGYRNSLYRNQGDGTFTKVTDAWLDQDGGYHEAASWAD